MPSLGIRSPWESWRLKNTERNHRAEWADQWDHIDFAPAKSEILLTFDHGREWVLAQLWNLQLFPEPIPHENPGVWDVKFPDEYSTKCIIPHFHLIIGNLVLFSRMLLYLHHRNSKLFFDLAKCDTFKDEKYQTIKMFQLHKAKQKLAGLKNVRPNQLGTFEGSFFGGIFF